jgi:hypothetical protein
LIVIYAMPMPGNVTVVWVSASGKLPLRPILRGDAVTGH